VNSGSIDLSWINVIEINRRQEAGCETWRRHGPGAVCVQLDFSTRIQQAQQGDPSLLGDLVSFVATHTIMLPFHCDCYLA
jgi:hypothetical protein